MASLGRPHQVTKRKHIKGGHSLGLTTQKFFQIIVNIMCMTAICGICHKKSWTGCGAHVASVMDVTPQENWCTCSPIDEAESSKYPPRAGTGFARSLPPK